MPFFIFDKDTGLIYLNAPESTFEDDTEDVDKMRLVVNGAFLSLYCWWGHCNTQIRNETHKYYLYKKLRLDQHKNYFIKWFIGLSLLFLDVRYELLVVKALF